MINEILFFTHIALITVFLLTALTIGKEALIATLCLCTILSNLFVTKQVTLFGFSVVNTDVFAVGSILGLNLLQEFFGSHEIKKAISINFMITITYLVMSQIHLWYLPNTFDTTQLHFESLLSPMPRIIIASICVYVLVQIIDAWLYAYLKQIFNAQYLVLRNIISLTTTQFLDTVLFSFGALYGNVHSISHVIMISFCIKLIVIACSTPCIAFARKMQSYF